MYAKFSLKAVAVAVLLTVSVAGIATERVTLQEMLAADSQLSRAEIEKKINDTKGKGAGGSLNQAAADAQAKMVRPVAPPPSLPEIDCIKGVGSNLRACLVVNGVRSDVKEGDVRDGWKVVSINSAAVRLKRGKVQRDIEFRERIDMDAGVSAVAPVISAPIAPLPGSPAIPLSGSGMGMPSQSFSPR